MITIQVGKDLGLLVKALPDYTTVSPATLCTPQPVDDATGVSIVDGIKAGR